MGRRRGTLTAAAVLGIASFVLAGCAIVDQFSGRAVEYNLQAEQATQQALLLNVIRASLRRPMQFTSLQSITGTASANASVSGGYTNTHQTPYLNPFSIIPANTNAALARLVTGTGGATASMSGGPTFTVPVLDTQEFYQGILTPVSHQIIDYYVQQGYPQQLLMDLFIAKIEVISTDSPTCDRFTFHNAVRNELQIGQFKALADYLLGSGLSTERASDSVPYGPPISSVHEPLNASDTAKMVEAYSKVSAAGLDIRSDGQNYRLQRRTSRYRFCFALRGRNKPVWLGAPEDEIYCGHFRPSQTTGARPASGQRSTTAAAADAGLCGPASRRQGLPEEGTSSFQGVKLSDAVLQRIARLQEGAAAAGASEDELFPVHRFRNRHVTFRFQTRSVEGILYYLGEITRQHLTPEAGQSRVAQTKTSLHYGSFPPEDCDPFENGGRRQEKTDMVRLGGRRERDVRPYYCENLFRLETNPGPGSFLSVQYDGTTYAIPSEPALAGRSLQVLELIKQLMALHTSAKQLPSSTVISIIGGTSQ